MSSRKLTNKLFQGSDSAFSIVYIFVSSLSPVIKAEGNSLQDLLSVRSFLCHAISILQEEMDIESAGSGN